MPQIAEFEKSSPDIVIASIGGSVIRPDRTNIPFAQSLTSFLSELIDNGKIPVMIIGGGGQARFAKEDLIAMGVTDPDAWDRVGIAITQANARIVQEDCRSHGLATVLIEPHVVKEQGGVIFKYDSPKKGEVYISGGLIKNRTTDTIAAVAAMECCAHWVFNVSNTEGIHPKNTDGTLDTSRILDHMSWRDYRASIPEKHVSSGSFPFDPIASKIADEQGLNVAFIGGNDTQEIFTNWKKSLSGRPFMGTVIRS